MKGHEYMTGRELIIHILENNLEDVDIIQNGKLVGFLTVDEAAAKFNVGRSTILVWSHYDMISNVQIGNETFIPQNASLKIEKGETNV